MEQNGVLFDTFKQYTINQYRYKYYFETIYGEGGYMPIVKFSKKNVNKILKIVKTKNKNIEIKSGNKAYKTFRNEASDAE